MGGFPEAKGGGSLILAWQVKHKKVVVVGGGEVSLFPPFPIQTFVDIDTVICR